VICVPSACGYVRPSIAIPRGPVLSVFQPGCSGAVVVVVVVGGAVVGGDVDVVVLA
jgi:hypothetical protein